MGDCDVSAILTHKLQSTIESDEENHEEPSPDDKKSKRKKKKSTGSRKQSRDENKIEDNSAEINEEDTNVVSVNPVVEYTTTKTFKGRNNPFITVGGKRGSKGGFLEDISLDINQKSKSSSRKSSRVDSGKSSTDKSVDSYISDVDDDDDDDLENDEHIVDEKDDKNNNKTKKDKKKKKDKEKKIGKGKKVDQTSTEIQKVNIVQDSDNEEDSYGRDNHSKEADSGDENTAFGLETTDKPKEKHNKLKTNMNKAKSFFKRKFSTGSKHKNEVQEISIKPEAEEAQHCWEMDPEPVDQKHGKKNKKDKSSKKDKKSKSSKLGDSLESIDTSRQSSAASCSSRGDGIQVIADANYDGTQNSDSDDVQEFNLDS